ncbi:protein PET100 homolog, mitochondrial isoform X3 [Canis lupus baileyi]|uniref:protein PET100 homolog, mitochondrial isoform X3 n=1 Tax=Canis lupus baileyi TaxID=143281 RepID=UPI000BAA07C6|eukprot:XP_022262814.1 protein PET100 homolog, mitochondrial isoform X1 [Canis lupus familiaris]
MGVKLEVFRMTLYLTFPVAMFWIANQAEWFEDYVIQRKRELWPPEKEDQVLIMEHPSMRILTSCCKMANLVLLLPVPGKWQRARHQTHS